MTLPSADRRSWVEQVMGLPVSVLVRGPGVRTRPDVAAAVQAVYAHLRQADRTFSTYRPDSEISRLRRGELPAGNPDVQAVLELCAVARDATEGWFDASLPDPDGQRRIDPSGLVKGWAVERAADALRGPEGIDWVLNAGGDVAASAAYGDSWRVGVEDPRDRSRMLAIVACRDGAVATSGSAARGDHVFNPHTGRPAHGLASATVAGPSLMWADVYATAAFARGPAALAWLESRSGYEGMLVHPDGTMTQTAGWGAVVVG